MLSRILVCGGRDANIEQSVADKYITEIIANCKQNIEFVSGGARGGDKLGEVFAASHGYNLIQFKPDWKTHGRAAGPIRNHQMVDYICKCDDSVVIAFWDGVSRGTNDTITYAQSKQVPVHIIKYKREADGSISII